MTDDPHERPALAHGLRDPRELGVVLEQAPQRLRLLADLARKQRSRLVALTGSGNDTRFTSDEDALDLETVVEDDDIRGESDVESTDVREPERSRRDGDAAPSASSSETPSACKFRTASIIDSRLPASIPSGARTAPSCTESSTLPRL